MAHISDEIHFGFSHTYIHTYIHIATYVFDEFHFIPYYLSSSCYSRMLHHRTTERCTVPACSGANQRSTATAPWPITLYMTCQKVNRFYFFWLSLLLSRSLNQSPPLFGPPRPSLLPVRTAVRSLQVEPKHWRSIFGPLKGLSTHGLRSRVFIYDWLHAPPFFPLCIAFRGQKKDRFFYASGGNDWLIFINP